MSDNFNYRADVCLPDDREIIRGAKLDDVEQLRTTLLRQVYAGNFVHSYFKFGDLPIPFVEGQTAHTLCIGDSGAGKTTTKYARIWLLCCRCLIAK